MKSTKPTQYKVIFNKKSAKYQVQELNDFLFFFKKWETVGYLTGAAGTIWIVEYTYKTERQAIDAMVLLVKKDEEFAKKQALKDELINSKKDFKEITSENISDTNPEYNL